MSTIHPLFHDALRAIAPVSTLVRPYTVTLRMAGHSEQVNILAQNACDAITSFIDTYFDGEDCMPPDGMAIDARAMSDNKRAD